MRRKESVFTTQIYGNKRGVFTHVASIQQIYGNKRIFLQKKKSPTPTGFVWNTNMAAVSLFSNTNMAAVTLCEYALYLE